MRDDDDAALRREIVEDRPDHVARVQIEPRGFAGVEPEEGAGHADGHVTDQ